MPLKDTKAVDDAVQAVLKSQQYKGLFLADQANQLGESYEKNKAMLLSQEELDLLLLYNAHLYQQAAEGICRVTLLSTLILKMVEALLRM